MIGRGADQPFQRRAARRRRRRCRPRLFLRTTPVHRARRGARGLRGRRLTEQARANRPGRDAPAESPRSTRASRWTPGRPTPGRTAAEAFGHDLPRRRGTWRTSSWPRRARSACAGALRRRLLRTRRRGWRPSPDAARLGGGACGRDLGWIGFDPCLALVTRGTPRPRGDRRWTRRARRRWRDRGWARASEVLDVDVSVQRED